MSPPRPMLACDAPAKLQFPLYASPKIDGIRAIIHDGVVYSRSGKPIPNKYIQSVLGHSSLNGLDGELAVGPPNAPDLMQKTTSGVMSREGEPDFTFWVFDLWNMDEVYHFRLRELQSWGHSWLGIIRVLAQEELRSQEDLRIYEEGAIADGYEGVVVRRPFALYKHGRSTAREGYLLKLKRFVDSEAEIIGFEERMHNTNEAKEDELGFTKRASNKEGLVPMGTLGAFKCRTPEGVEFSVGTGLTDSQRAAFWEIRESLLGQLLTYKHFPIGVKDAPRLPVYKAIRSKLDLGG